MKRISFFQCIILAVFLVSCSTNSIQNYKVEEENTTDMVYLTMFGNKTDAVNTQAIEEILHDFMVDYPNINISYESVKGDEYFRILKKRLKSGNGDDIFIVNHDTTIEFTEKGYLSDLTDLAKQIDFHPLMKKQVYANDDKVYFFPTTISSFGLYCNMDMLQLYGLSVPKNRQEFLEVLEFFKNKGITPICANNDISLKTVMLGIGMYPLYQQDHVQDVLHELNQNPEKMASQLAPGFAFVESLIKNEYVDADIALETVKTKDDLTQFASGSYPFMITGVWADSRLKLLEPDFRYEIHAYPILEEGSMLVVNADSRLAVNANSEHEEAAKEFLAYFMNNEELQKFVDVQDSHSPLQGQHDYRNDQISSLKTYIDENQIVIGSDENLNYPIWDISKKGIEMLLQGSTSEQALDAMKEDHLIFLKEGYTDEGS